MAIGERVGKRDGELRIDQMDALVEPVDDGAHIGARKVRYWSAKLLKFSYSLLTVDNFKIVGPRF